MHRADYLISQRLAEILAVPVAYLFCDDDELADAMLLLHSLPVAKRRKTIKALKSLASTE